MILMSLGSIEMPRHYNKGYSGRFYKELPDGLGELPSMTNVLGVIGKPALVNWAANKERELVLEAAAGLWEDAPTAPKMSRTVYLATLMDRLGKTKAHVRELEAASEIGTQVHARIEWGLRRRLLQEVGEEPRMSEKAAWAYAAYERWANEVDLLPIVIEQVVWDRGLGIAGTLDLYAELVCPAFGPGRHRAVLDWKTGKAVYFEAYLQTAGYRHCLINMGHHTTSLGPLHCGVLRLPKVETDPEFEFVPIPEEDQPRHLATLQAVKRLWDSVQIHEAKQPKKVKKKEAA